MFIDVVFFTVISVRSSLKFFNPSSTSKKGYNHRYGGKINVFSCFNSMILLKTLYFNVITVKNRV